MTCYERGCQPAATVLGVGEVNCNSCPFPFCVSAEAGNIKAKLREHLARIMQKLGNTVEEISEAIGTTPRTIYRYTAAHGLDCVQCNLIFSRDVVCESRVYTVVYTGGQYIIILSKHRRATAEELSIVRHFTEYVFPSSVVERVNSGHDHWLLGRVGIEEAKNFQRMCTALNEYTMSLNKSAGVAECLQTTRP